jgi:hypothetical protein
MQKTEILKRPVSYSEYPKCDIDTSTSYPEAFHCLTQSLLEFVGQYNKIIQGSCMCFMMDSLHYNSTLACSIEGSQAIMFRDVTPCRHIEYPFPRQKIMPRYNDNEVD